MTANLEQASRVDSGKNLQQHISGQRLSGRKTYVEFVTINGKSNVNNSRQATIEPVIGHPKSDYRIARCSLQGAKGAGLNLTLAASAWNTKKWINELLLVLVSWLEDCKVTKWLRPSTQTLLHTLANVSFKAHT